MSFSPPSLCVSSFPLALKGPPVFIKTPVDQIGVSGGVASFVCQATGDPKPRVTWNKKGKKVNSQRFEVSITEAWFEAYKKPLVSTRERERERYQGSLELGYIELFDSFKNRTNILLLTKSQTWLTKNPGPNTIAQESQLYIVHSAAQ